MIHYILPLMHLQTLKCGHLITQEFFPVPCFPEWRGSIVYEISLQQLQLFKYCRACGNHRPVVAVFTTGVIYRLPHDCSLAWINSVCVIYFPIHSNFVSKYSWI